MSAAAQRQLARLAAVAVLLVAGAALAADRRQGGGSCCSLVWLGLMLYVYRSGGVGWGLALGTGFFPGIFGWFIWREAGFGTGARWVALINAVLQVLGVLALGVLAVVAATMGGSAGVAPRSAADRLTLYEQGFVRRCSASQREEVCRCVAEASRQRDEDERKELAFNLQQRALSKWLEATTAACLTGQPPPAATRDPGSSGPVNPKDDPLGLHPLSSVTSDPPGATVYVDDQKRGVTPLDTPLTAAARNRVRVELDGYFPESLEREPNANEHFTLNFTLKRAARVKARSEPAGARVLAGGKEVLARTPGLTALLEPGETELLFLLAGHQASRQTVTLASGESEVEATLTPGVKVTVRSTPPGAEVMLDGAVLGQAPLELWVSPKGKHELMLSAENRTPVKKVLKDVKKPVVVDVALVDGELAAARQRVSKARARYDAANAKLEKQQGKIERARDPAALERQLAPLERAMEKASDELEKAEAALKALEDARGLVAPPKPDEDD